MEPTIGAELAAVRRSLAAWMAGEGMPPLAVADIREAVRALERIEKTWARVLPHLAADNAAVAGLLLDLAPGLPSGLRAEVEGAVGERPPRPERSLFDVGAADARNRQLRELLARAVGALPAGEEGAQVRARVATELDAALETRPW